MDDFVELFDRGFAPRLGIRAATFRAVIREACACNARHIVETGCMRKEDNWAGDGQSTLIWTRFAANTYNGSFKSVDLDEGAVSLAIEKCVTQTKLSCVEIHNMDSVKFLMECKTPIDVLYLDSFDLDQANPHPAALHCLMELTAAVPRLHKNSIVFVDDSPMNVEMKVTGKAKYVAEFMEKLDIYPFTFGYQAAWKLP